MKHYKFLLASLILSAASFSTKEPRNRLKPTGRNNKAPVAKKDDISENKPPVKNPEQTHIIFLEDSPIETGGTEAKLKQALEITNEEIEKNKKTNPLDQKKEEELNEQIKKIEDEYQKIEKEKREALDNELEYRNQKTEEKRENAKSEIMKSAYNKIESKKEYWENTESQPTPYSEKIISYNKKQEILDNQLKNLKESLNCLKYKRNNVSTLLTRIRTTINMRSSIEKAMNNKNGQVGEMLKKKIQDFPKTMSDIKKEVERESCMNESFASIFHLTIDKYDIFDN